MEQVAKRTKGISRSALKLIAIVAMTLGHIGLILPVGATVSLIFQSISMITMPVMCMMMAEGFQYTSNKFKYGLRLGVAAVLSQVPYMLLFNTTIGNVLFTLFLSYLVLVVLYTPNIVVYDRFLTVFTKAVVVMFLCILSLNCDWGITCILWVVCFYQFREYRIDQLSALNFVISFQLISVLYTCYMRPVTFPMHMFGMILSLPLLAMYNGERGKGDSKLARLSFYMFYPAHMVVLYLLAMSGIS